MAKTGVIVIDPGHGGKKNMGGSDANHAVSPSGILEKNVTLRMAFLVCDHLTRREPDVKVILTRDQDINLSLSDRAKVAKKNKADLMLSIHCNQFDKKERGTETLISPASGNKRHADDKVFAQKIQDAAFGVFKKFDDQAQDRGVKDQALDVLKDSDLGASTRGCMLQLEFIDVKAVDDLLNIGPQSTQVRAGLARALAKALIAAL